MGSNVQKKGRGGSILDYGERPFGPENKFNNGVLVSITKGDLRPLVAPRVGRGVGSPCTLVAQMAAAFVSAA